MRRKAQARRKLTPAQTSAGTMMIARPAALNPTVMTNPAVINTAGQAATALRTAAPLMGIPAGIATGMRAQLVNGIVMTGHAKTIPAVIVNKAIVCNATVRLMAILVVTVTGTPAQRVVGVGMVGPVVIVSAMTASRNGVAMACRLKAVIPAKTAPRMAARHGVHRKRAARGLAAVAIWTPAYKRPFALTLGPKIADNNVVRARMRNLVDSAKAANSHLNQAAERLTVMAAMRPCAGKLQHLLARSQAAKLQIQMVLPGASPASLSAKPRRRKQPLPSLQVRQDVALTSSAQLVNAFSPISDDEPPLTWVSGGFSLRRQSTH